MTDTAGIPPIAITSYRRGVKDALDKLSEKAAGDRQWEDDMGPAHAWLRQLVQDVREELAGGGPS